MKFTALPVNVGDSFLLQVDNKVILVDGGMSQSHIVGLLMEERIPNNHIDLLVCTHYDADHINGIIGILKSKKFTFTEIWLPEIIGSIGNTISKNLFQLIEYLNENGLNDVFYSNGDSQYSYDVLEIEEQSKKNNSIKKIKTVILKNFINYMKYIFHRRGLHNDYEYSNKFEKMMDNMLSYAYLINSSINTGAKIRWFKFQNKLIHNNYGYKLYSENALETGTSIYDEKLFFNLLHMTTLSKINQHSLVFKFDDAQYPNILYTADSDLNFTSTPITLVDNSIVTAPHHGSDANDIAYSKISGNNLTFVRSESFKVKRLSKEYKKQTKRFCTVCRNKTAKQKVELNLNNNVFQTIADDCVC